MPQRSKKRTPGNASQGKGVLREAAFWVMAVLVSVLFALSVGRFLPELVCLFTSDPDDDRFEVTGYCNCEKCCGWERDKEGKPIYNYGKMKGRPKIIGQTSSGTIARRGTVAADPKVLKPGTKLEIPGYGRGVVEDIGGAIKGRHIDLWFPTHEEAKSWGKRYLRIEVCK